MSICCFAGHNKVYDEEIKTKLREVCKRLITQKGVNEFWVGNYGCFDNGPLVRHTNSSSISLLLRIKDSLSA